MDNRARASRVELAAAFRLAARLGFHEGVWNHFSLALTEDGREFWSIPTAATSPSCARATCCESTSTAPRSPGRRGRGFRVAHPLGNLHEGAIRAVTHADIVDVRDQNPGIRGITEGRRRD